MGVDHLDLVVSNLERSLTFYRGLLGPLGYDREGTIVGERGERVTYLNSESDALSLRASQSDGRDAPYDRYAVGIHHIAFAAPSRASVDERARWVPEHGGTLESAPREYDYTPGYYAVFFYDPDGIKLEVVHRPPY
jgi:glyoxylase I family protein